MMENTKLDIHICGPMNGLPFWPTSIFISHMKFHISPKNISIIYPNKYPIKSQ